VLIPRFYHGAVEGKQIAKSKKVAEMVPSVEKVTTWNGDLAPQPGENFYSVRKAFIGSMLAARRAGMNPATAANAHRTRTAAAKVNGS
jgi:hypothetical protein